MERFIERFRDRIVGTLSGADRLLFRGTLRSISYLHGMDVFLSCQHVLYKNFKAFVEKLSAQLKQQAKDIAAQAQRPHEHLESSSESKEEKAREIMERDQITEGLVCVLTCVENCHTFSVKKDKASKLLKLMRQPRKCLHVYYYFVDREFGLMHVRLQTWIPFPVQVCLNGRDWLARQMDREGIGYEQRDNCFARIDNLPRAQALLKRLDNRRWLRFLKKFARLVNPLLPGLKLYDYYWTLRQTEYATDVMFRDEASLKEVYPHLVRHAVSYFGSANVLRFLGRRTNSRFNGEVTTKMKHRLEGICVKHYVEENSIKMYDKQGSVLRIETTINNPRRYKVYRRVERKGRPTTAWIPMRKGLADLPRRVQVSLDANQRYLQALGVVAIPQAAHRVLDPVSRRVRKQGRSYRALRPLSKEEAEGFRLLLDGQFHLQGLRNKDLRRVLFPEPERDPASRKRTAGRVTRYFRLLRAHGLIRKVSHTTYYRVTDKGTQLMTAAIQLRETDLALLAA